MRLSLRSARVNRGLTQEETAKSLGKTKKTIASWENGKTKPSVDMVEPICKLFGVSYDDIDWNRSD